MFGIGAALSGALAAAKTVIAGIAAKIGSVVAGFAKKVVGLLPKINGEKIKGVLGVVGNIFSIFKGFLGIKKDTTAEELGVKAEECDKTVDDFASTEEYINHLNNEIQVDKEKMEKLSDEQRLGYAVTGVSLGTKAVEEKIGGITFSPEALVALMRIFLGLNLNVANDGDKIIKFIVALKDRGIYNLTDVSEYLEGVGNSDRIKTGIAFEEALNDVDADVTNDDLKKIIRDDEGELL